MNPIAGTRSSRPCRNALREWFGMRQQHTGIRLLWMETIASHHYSLAIEYGGVPASFPVRFGRKGVDDPCVSQT